MKKSSFSIGILDTTTLFTTGALRNLLVARTRAISHKILLPTQGSMSTWDLFNSEVYEVVIKYSVSGEGSSNSTYLLTS